MLFFSCDLFFSTAMTDGDDAVAAAAEAAEAAEAVEAQAAAPQGAPPEADVHAAMTDAAPQLSAEQTEQVRKLQLLLDRTAQYSNFLGSSMGKVTYGGSSTGNAAEDNEKASSATTTAEAETTAASASTQPVVQGKAAPRKELGEKLSELPERRAAAARVAQPPTVTGGTLRPYQLDALNWLIQLFENGMNGILADQMGLGKTVTTIALLAHLWFMGVRGPFLVVAPVSTLSNWMAEFARWTPALPVVMYHGTKDERAALRQQILAMEGRAPSASPAAKRRRTSSGSSSTRRRSSTTKTEPQAATATATATMPVVVTSFEIAIKDSRFLMTHHWKYLVVDEAHRLKNFECKLICQLRQLHTESRLLLTGTPLQNSLTELWSLLNFLLPELFDDLASFKRWFDFTDVLESGSSAGTVSTALHSELVDKLHDVLKPFLLRRLKQDVEKSLPKKAEVVLYARQTPAQHAFYNAVKNRTFVCQGFSYNNLLMQLRKICNHPFLFPQEAIVKVFREADADDPAHTPSPLLAASPTPSLSPAYPPTDDSTVTLTGMRLRHPIVQQHQRQTVDDDKDGGDENDEDDDGDEGDDVAVIPTFRPTESPQTGTTTTGTTTAVKSKAPRSAWNVFMAERWAAYHLEHAEDKNCAGSSHNNTNAASMAALTSVFAREWRDLPAEERQRYQDKYLEEQRACEALRWEEEGGETPAPLTVDKLVGASGKMQLVHELLPVLRQQGHKVLVFSQMTRMLDILESYVALMGYRFSRIDGTMSQPERQQQIEAFNTDPDVFLFLLSTRAGGQGINLAAADTVIIYDSDWNPQMDLQAQDRCHRIGQTKPVVVYRLVTANSVDSRILKRARSKLFLERLVVGKGTFSRRTSTRLTANDIRELLSINNKGEERPITDAEIAKVLDRDYVISHLAAAAAAPAAPEDASSTTAADAPVDTAVSASTSISAASADGTSEDRSDAGFEYVAETKAAF